MRKLDMNVVAALLLAAACVLPLAVQAVGEESIPGKLVRAAHFRPDVTEMEAPGAAVLRMVAADYATAKPGRVIVVGYAAPDEGGLRAGAAYAQSLSERRAGSARNYLYKHGIPLSRMVVRGRGLALPAEGPESASRRSVEIHFE